MKKEKRKKLNLSKILGVFVVLLTLFIIGFFLRGNSNFTIPIAMLVGALLLFVTVKVNTLYYDKYKRKSNLLSLIGALGISAIFIGIINLMVFIFYLFPVDIVMRRGIIILVVGFILVGVSYILLRKKDN